MISETQTWYGLRGMAFLQGSSRLWASNQQSSSPGQLFCGIKMDLLEQRMDDLSPIGTEQDGPRSCFPSSRAGSQIRSACHISS